MKILNTNKRIKRADHTWEIKRFIYELSNNKYNDSCNYKNIVINNI